jgi:hypothetical protein
MGSNHRDHLYKIESLPVLYKTADIHGIGPFGLILAQTTTTTISLKDGYIVYIVIQANSIRIGVFETSLSRIKYLN